MKRKRRAAAPLRRGPAILLGDGCLLLLVLAGTVFSFLTAFSVQIHALPLLLGCAAAALATLQILSEDVMGEITDKGNYLRGAIESLELPCLGKTRGLGLMIGIEVKPGRTNRAVAVQLMENGLLVLTAGPALRLLPPLTITKDEMDKGLAIMKQTLGGM